MVDALLQILRVQSCQDVEEILARRAFVLIVPVRKILLERRVLLEHRIDPTDRELLVVRDLHVHHLAFLHQLLFPGQNVLDEVLVDHSLVGQVVLEVLVQIDNTTKRLDNGGQRTYKSYLLLNFHANSEACIMPIVRFLLSVICWSTILFVSALI